jgi:tetratricopeptide (TPR) repeat protein
MKHDREAGSDARARDPELDAAFDLLVHTAKAPADFRAKVMARVAHQRVWRGVFAWVQNLALPTPALVLTGLLLVSLLGNSWLGWQYYRGEPSTMRGTARDGDWHALVQQAQRDKRAGNRARALETYRKVIKQGVPQLEDLALALNEVAWDAYEQYKAGEPRKVNEGLPLARLAVQLYPDEAPYLDTLAELLCATGDQMAAIEVSTRAVRLARLNTQLFRQNLARFQHGPCP